ncbi:helix-turn-helix domain-containing protein [Brevibacillus choshinensis]|uniref:winged helix-turn-helix transcriptional regulator n=1 Tax=Brevibacillus choshinensis TaxID=54911 RepID=UPI002E1B6579|nr:helix-turn-helix domain-containing protein [Brevibacillus choshinensis]MED4781149.1 helix-turn-helix domain-containing protein [Brevibacillus choshinensis]
MTSSIRTHQPDISLTVCSYSRVLEIISNKWSALVIYALEDGSVRYGEMSRRIEGISKKMLTQTLRQLERDGLVHRELIPSMPPIVEYSLTPLGQSLILPMHELKRWTNEHYAQVEQARAEYDKTWVDE